MSIEELMKLRTSNEAPFNHEEYTIWLHNKIIENVHYELWKFREEKSSQIKSGYAACNHIFNFESLKIIKN